MFVDTPAGVLEPVMTSIGTEKGYRGTAEDKCVRYDIPTKKLIFDNNQDFCYNGVDVTPVCKKKLGDFKVSLGVFTPSYFGNSSWIWKC